MKTQIVGSGARGAGSDSGASGTRGAVDDDYPFHRQSQLDIDAEAVRLFAYLDDHRRLIGHMEKPSLMMAGAVMQVQTDALEGRAVDSVIRITGRALGARLAVEEIVTERAPPFQKTWETRGQPRLLVIGAYRMGFTISPHGRRSRLVVFIDYQLPPHGFSHWLGRLFGGAYAAWCTNRMTRDARLAALSETATVRLEPPSPSNLRQSESPAERPDT